MNGSNKILVVMFVCIISPKEKILGENFAGLCFCGNFYLRIVEKNAKITTRKNLVPHGILTVFESCSPLRVEQRKLQDRLAALERLTHEQATLQPTTEPEGMPGGRGSGSFFTLSENNPTELGYFSGVAQWLTHGKLAISLARHLLSIA